MTMKCPTCKTEMEPLDRVGTEEIALVCSKCPKGENVWCYNFVTEVWTLITGK